MAFLLTIMIMELRHIDLVDDGDGYGIWGDPEIPDWVKEVFHISSWGDLAGDQDFHDWVDTDGIHHINILDADVPADGAAAPENVKDQATGQFNIKFFTGKEQIIDPDKGGLIMDPDGKTPSEHYVSYMVINEQVFEGPDKVEIIEFEAMKFDLEDEDKLKEAKETFYKKWDDAFKERRSLNYEEKGLDRFFSIIENEDGTKKVDFEWIFQTLPEEPVPAGSTRAAATVDVLIQNPELIGESDVLGEITTKVTETPAVPEENSKLSTPGENSKLSIGDANGQRRLLPMERLLHDISSSK